MPANWCDILIHDYIELAKELIEVAKSKGAKQSEIDTYLKDHLTTKRNTKMEKIDHIKSFAK